MTFALFLFFVVGLCFGSMITVVVPRLHARESGIAFGRSRCPYCKEVLHARDLVPVLSYLLLGGHCRHCKKTIHWQYPVTELFTGIVFVLLFKHYWSPTPTTETIAITTIALLYAVVLILVGLYDLRFGEIPDSIIVPALFVAVILSPLPFTPPIKSSIVGALIPLLFFGLLIAISNGTWMGGGDLRLGAFMGMILGWQHVLVALMCAYVLGSIVSIFLLSAGFKKRGDAIPFGPFLVIGTLFAILWGEYAVQWYIHTTGLA